MIAHCNALWMGMSSRLATQGRQRVSASTGPESLRAQALTPCRSPGESSALVDAPGDLQFCFAFDVLSLLGMLGMPGPPLRTLFGVCNSALASWLPGSLAPWLPPLRLPLPPLA